MSDFEAFYRANLRLVYAMALARDANPGRAEDLTPETFLRAWQHRERRSELEPLAQRAWLVRTVENLAIDVWRRERWFTTELPERPDPSPGLTEGAALRLDVARALAALEEADRELVILRYFLQMNSREIAEMLGLAEGAEGPL